MIENKREERSPSASGDDASSGGRRPFFKRPKTCPFQGERIKDVDYKNTRLLLRYISERGKIVPSRISATSQKSQRKLSQAIKRARFLALLPYVSK